MVLTGINVFLTLIIAASTIVQAYEAKQSARFAADTIPLQARAIHIQENQTVLQADLASLQAATGRADFRITHAYSVKARRFGDPYPCYAQVLVHVANVGLHDSALFNVNVEEINRTGQTISLPAVPLASNQFVANMTHPWRSPMFELPGFTATVRSGELASFLLDFSYLGWDWQNFTALRIQVFPVIGLASPVYTISGFELQSSQGQVSPLLENPDACPRWHRQE
jgi:hypothetical protein